jgi:hypothetical protein
LNLRVSVRIIFEFVVFLLAVPGLGDDVFSCESELGGDIFSVPDLVFGLVTSGKYNVHHSGWTWEDVGVELNKSDNGFGQHNGSHFVRSTVRQVFFPSPGSVRALGIAFVLERKKRTY